MNPLKIESLVKKYDSKVAVNDVSFEIAEGEIYGLLGPNGAGKTSIISIITTLQVPDSGNVEVFGHSVVDEPVKAKLKTGCVPQELVQHGFFTIEEILHFHSGYYGVAKNRDRINFLIERLGLAPHRDLRVKQLSGGMKRRLLIAKALVHRPRLLLLDEPTAGVDVELRTSLWEFVQELKEEGVSILLTTHYLEEAETLCDRVGIINHGRLQLEGKPKDLVRDFTEREVVMTLKAPVAKISHPFLISQSDYVLKFRFASEHSIGQLLDELPLEIRGLQDLTIHEGKLEDAFQRVLSDSVSNDI